MIGITLGDACGVGPEILLRAWHAGQLKHPCVVFGDRAPLELAAEKLQMAAPLHVIARPGEAQRGALNLVDLGLLRREDITIGKVSAGCGSAALRYIRTATKAAQAGGIEGIVTLPVNKEACRLSESDFEGHTELIAGMCGIEDYTMMLVSPKMIVTHVSTHVSLRDAIDRVTRDRILTVTRLTQSAVLGLRGRARIAIAGMNPHAGEHGAFGREEIEEIEPAVAAAQRAGIDAHGPIPADTLFMKLLSGQYDAAVCMYHDQGHIPMKLHGFADAVNITLGLPIIRTSVDHGTAFDIAYRGIASTENFAIAVEMAIRLAAHRRTS